MYAPFYLCIYVVIHPCAERRAGIMDADVTEPASVGGGAEEEVDNDDAMDVEDDEGDVKKGQRRGKGKTAYSGIGKKKWFEMFPAVTKRARNSIRKKKGAVRG